MSPTLPNADELEVVAFRHIAKTKLDALLADGWKINGYSIQRDGRLGLVTAGAFVGWYSNACDNSAAADARAEAAEARVKELEEVLTALTNSETVSVHVGYDNGSGGGNYTYADAVRTDGEEFIRARSVLSGGTSNG